jgi:hypothetical protein
MIRFSLAAARPVLRFRTVASTWIGATMRHPAAFTSTTTAAASPPLDSPQPAMAGNAVAASAVTAAEPLPEAARLQQVARVRATATRAVAYENLHRSNVNLSKPRVALQAWRELQELPEEYLEVADMDSVVKLLGTFAYFRPFWEKGHEGPAQPLPPRAAGVPRDAEEITIPPECFSSVLGTGARQSGQFQHPNATSHGGGGAHQQRAGRAPSAGGKSPRQANDAAVPAAKRFAQRPKAADVVGQMIE